jgi:hypothetical protein
VHDLPNQDDSKFIPTMHNVPHQIRSQFHHVDVQAYISNARIDSFSLVADMLYVGDNAPRIARALFEIALKNQWTGVVESILEVCCDQM